MKKILSSEKSHFPLIFLQVNTKILIRVFIILNIEKTSLKGNAS